MFSMHNKIVFQSFIQVYIFFLSKHVSLCYDCKFTIVLIICMIINETNMSTCLINKYILTYNLKVLVN